MKHFILGVAAAALISGGALAQATARDSNNPAIKDSSVARVDVSAKGRNSFTEAQARGRIAKAGYSSVSRLNKDQNGVWRGWAMHGRKKVAVGLDYKGNVTTR
ncbi:hypothetical protein FPZ24_04545 [Sphingomonas panacisoli]|uniref:PepSY domain-containing protein n=1 Tax=Sphingomonas panacisoli TaxID=1813879 RepID=A0A5B8LFZ2_9SPHN|nr:hypothetical protein [Sphingomonas panacisoli]QDZ06836.1 hypothetical protein FPZ24_04545 [Sphingomonas panacisoli]